MNKIYPRNYFFENIFVKIVFLFVLWMYGGRAGLVYEVGISVLLLYKVELPSLMMIERRILTFNGIFSFSDLYRQGL